MNALYASQRMMNLFFFPVRCHKSPEIKKDIIDVIQSPVGGQGTIPAAQPNTVSHTCSTAATFSPTIYLKKKKQ